MEMCGKCGGSDLRDSGVCRPCARAYAHAWRVANPERSAAIRAKSYAKEKTNPSPAVVATAARKKLRQAQQYRDNTEKFSEAARERYKKSHAALSEKYKANAEKMRADARAWQKANPEAVRIIKQNRRAKESCGKLTHGLAKKLFSLQQGMCVCCGKPLGNDYHLDHVHPLALGGSNTDDNIQLLRKTCNLQKNAKHPIEFMQQRGFLL